MNSLSAVYAALKSSHTGDPWPDVDTRLAWLESLARGIVENRTRIREAVWEDFRKPPVEADLTETIPVLLELKTARRSLRSWSEPRRLPSVFPLWGVSSRLRCRPKGVALIMSPWNYPFNLSLGPLVSSLAAGNRTVLKPSERVPHSSRLIAEIVGRFLPTDVASVVEGGPETGEQLLQLPFDHFFFTGGAAVGRLVMRAAAKHLSTVTLELGGKTPAIVDGSVDLSECAEKIVRGKFLNAGQTCIAPDYVVVHRDYFDAVTGAVLRASESLHAEVDIAGPVDDEHAARLDRLVAQAVEDGAHIHRDQNRPGGLIVVTGVPLTSSLMREEIFGPILPILRYGNTNELVGIIERNPTPLSTYVFTKNEDFAGDLATRVRTGSMCVNETLLHFVHPRLPFGGVGLSGSGRTHGKAGYLAFSDSIPTMRQNFRKGIIPLLYPATGKLQRKLRELLFRYLAR
jgi:aldehyde dehydrogenase (NAD+)